MRLGPLAGPLAALWLSGCAPCPPERCELAVTLGPGDGAYRVPGLEGLAQSFLGSEIPAADGGPTPAAAHGGSRPGTLRAAPAAAGLDRGGERVGGMALAGGRGLPGLSLDRDMLKPGSDTPYRQRVDRNLGVRITHLVPVSAQSHLTAGLRLGVGQHGYRLPAGLGPLRDPIAIRFRRLVIGPELGLRHRRPVVLPPGAALELSVLAGHEVTLLDSHLTSALLDVRSRDSFGQSHLTLGAGVVLASGPELQAMVRLLEGGQFTWRSELRLPLGR